MRRIITALLISLFLTGPAWAAEEEFHITASRVEKSGDELEASGNVKVRGQDLDLTCSYLLYDTATGDFWATGSPRLVEKNGEMHAQVLHYNTRRKDAHILDGQIILYQEPAVLRGSSITRYSDDLYVGEDISYTPCLGEKPAWSIRAASLDIPLEGYGTATHARFQIKDYPLLYVPYLLFPAKLERQTGLLFPSIGSSSEGGFQYGQPLFVTLGRSADITLTPTWVSKRGLLMAAELRYVVDYERKGGLYLEGLRDKLGGELYNGSALYSVQDGNLMLSQAPRPDTRWRLMANQSGGRLNWDINLVSGPDYFRDLGSFYTAGGGADIWKGAGAEDQSEAQISRIGYSGSQGPVSYDISALYKQDLSARIYDATLADAPTDTSYNDMTLQELPRLKARLAQQQIPGTPLRYRATLESVHLSSEKSVRGLKDYANTELSLPLAWRPYLTLRPYVQEIYRDTRLQKKQSSERRLGENPTFSFDFDKSLYQEYWQRRGLSVSTAVYSPRFADGLYHQLIPDITWSKLARHGQNNGGSNDLILDADDVYPLLLPDDTWSQQYDIAFSLSNYIRSASASGAALAELRVSRPYNFLTKRWDVSSATLRLTPVAWLSLEHTSQSGRARVAHRAPDAAGNLVVTHDIAGKAEYDIMPFAMQQHKTALTLRDSRGDECVLAEEYTRGFATDPLIPAKSRYGRLRVNLAKGVGVWAEAKHDGVNERYEYIRQGLMYKDQCWGVQLYYEIQPARFKDQGVELNPPVERKSKIGLNVTLLGLGDMRTGYSLESK